MVPVESHDALFEACLAEARRRMPDHPAEGVFGPGSAMWRVLRRTAIPTTGLRAVLLQIAHPAVAAAGVQASNVRAEFVPRTLRTFDTVYRVMFADQATALEQARRVWAVHRHVRGDLPDGSPFRATDPTLLRWVLATMIDGAFVCHDRILDPLPRAERDALYRDWTTLGLLFGIPTDAMPPDATAFRAWFGQAVLSDLAIGDAARTLADFLLADAFRFRRMSETWAAGLLPPPVRDAYGLPWTRPRRLAYRGMLQTVRSVEQRVPAPIRWVPAYHRACARVARARGESPAWSGRAWARLEALVPV